MSPNSEPAGSSRPGGGPAGPQPAPASTARRNRLIAAAILAMIILILLLLRVQCHRPPGAFDYFTAKAESLGRKPDRILAFVRHDVHLLPYRGDAKGALGALWDASGSPEEKVALANALLAQASSPRTVGLDEVAPDRDKAADCLGTAYNLTITHRLVTADGTKETPVFSGPAGGLVGAVHSIEMTEPDRTGVTVRGSAETTKAIPRAGAISEEIVFTAQRPGDKPVTVVRELWHKANRVGPTGANVGDRHDFVVLPCRIGSYVREKEELLLQQRGTDNAAYAKHYLALLDYAVRSDTALAKLEKKKQVRAEFELPRILILSRFAIAPEPASAIDLRLNRTSFEGDPVAAYVAAEMRSFIESGLEHDFLMEWSGCASTSTFGVFCQLRDNYPNTAPRRLDTMVAALEALAEHGGADGKITFRARPPSGRDAPDLPAVAVTREGKGLRIRGGPVNTDFAKKLGQTGVRIPYDHEGRIDAAFDSLTDAALAVEVTLMAANGRPASSPAYVLDTRIDCGTEPLVAPKARFHFAWGEDRKSVV
jgi:hypothetical protein